MKPIPQHAERIDMMAVYRMRRQPSQFCPGLEAIVAYFVCPACHTEHEDPGFSPLVCTRCGLSMQCDGSGVHIWRDAPATVE